MRSRKMRCQKIFVTIFFLLLICFFPENFFHLQGAAGVSAAAQEPGRIRILLNGEELFTEVSPVIENGRTLVPVRAVLESFGADVVWNEAARTVVIKLGEIKMELAVGKGTARLNGWILPLDVPVKIIGNRTFVPLRFVAENLGAEVYWDGKGRTIFLTFTGVPPGVDFSPKGFSLYYGDLPVQVETYGVALGDTAEKVLRILGEPSRKDATTYGYQWWVYNGDPHHYLQVGIRDGSVVALYTCGQGWSFGPVRGGTSLAEFYLRFKTAGGLYVERTKTLYRLYHPTLVFNNTVATFYYDSLEGNRIVAMRLEDREVVGERYALFFKHRSAYGEREPYNLQKMREAEAADELQLFDLANAERARRGLPLLTWHRLAAQAALEHSREMFLHNYFSHVSAVTGKTLEQRLGDQGISFRLAAENIARGQLDAIEVHHGLMNSSGHRANILHRELRSLGVGIYRDCYTQNFVTER